jgi:membrane protein implicated in regulation of membrane protease activity
MDSARSFVKESRGMTWWLWMLLGLALAIAEAQIPTNFFLLAFGLGGLVVGLVTLVGLITTPWVEWLVFSLASVAAVVLFQRTLSRGHPTDGGRMVDDLRRESATVTEDVPAGGIGRAELRGTTWTARGSDGLALPRGTHCRVDRVDGLTLWLRPE